MPEAGVGTDVAGACTACRDIDITDPDDSSFVTGRRKRRSWRFRGIR